MNIHAPIDTRIAATHRALAQVWIDFESGLATVPIIARLERGKLRIEDYRSLLLNLRQQVIDGSRWIARAASHIEPGHDDLRSIFTRHAATEHRDYRMLEDNYVAAGGDRAAILVAEKNIGSEALSAWMFHAASKPNPFGLLGAMFIIEGLGQRMASRWAEAIRSQLDLPAEAVSFMAYHGANDEDHMEAFDEALTLVATDDATARSIVKHARVTARLYRLQLEELDNV